MHTNRNEDAESAPRTANASPPVGQVRGLGLVHALRVELEPVQLPWFVDELNTTYGQVKESMAHTRTGGAQSSDDPARAGSPNEAETAQRLDRSAYKLDVLDMIQRQLPMTGEAAAAAVASAWDEAGHDVEAQVGRAGEPTVVVGPAAIMTRLIEGAANNVTAALSEDVGSFAPGHRPPGSGVGGLTPSVAAKLQSLAAAAKAYTDLWVDLMLQQNYRFDPEHEPVRFDELE